MLLPWHQSTGSCSSARKPASDSRPLYADRHLPSHQASDRLIPEELTTPGFDGASIANDASSAGSLSFVFRILTCSGSCPELLLQRSLPRSFAAAAWSGLGPAPESRSRGASPHLPRSFTTSLWLTSFHSVSAAHTNYATFSATDFRCANTFRPQLTGFITCAEQPSRSGSCKPRERETLQSRLPNHWSGARSDRTSMNTSCV